MTRPSFDHSPTSLTLLERVKLRRPDAWRRLVELYGPLVYRWCRRSQLPPDDAADVVQEVFAAVAQHIDTFESRAEQGSFRAWLSTVTRHKILDLHRREQGRARAYGGTDAQEQLAQVPEQDGLSDSTHQADDRQLIATRAMELVRAEFENRTWDAFCRAVIDGQPPATIAEELGISVNAVYKAKSRVLRRLRQELGELPDN